MKLKLILLSSITCLIANIANAAVPTPGELNVYAINNIGQSANPYTSDFAGIAGAGGSAYFQDFSLNTTGGQAGSLSLYVGQNFSINSGQINNGGIQAGGNINATGATISGNVMGGGNLTGSGGTITGNVTLSGANNSSLTINGTVTQNTGSYTPILNLAQTSSFFQNASSTYGSMSQSSWITSSISSGALNVSGLQSGLNIVNLALSTEAGLNQIRLSGSSNAIVVFNITGNGSGNSQSLAALSINGLAYDQTLFNILNAGVLSMNGGPYTSVLAPNSTITFTDGNVEGNLIAYNLYGSGQVNTNEGLFTGFSSVPVSTPEPSTYLLMASLLGFSLIVSRRRLQLSK